jgi:parallel beta-helix repeat protein
MSTTSEFEPTPSIGRVLGRRAIVYLCLLVFAFALLLLLNTGNASAAGPTYVSADITANTTWDEDNSPYIVTANITIAYGFILEIEPNVTVMVDDGLGIAINGTLIADATADEPITFTSNGSTSWGAWNGLYFNESSSSSELDHVLIEYAYDPIMIYESSVAISNVRIHGAIGSYPMDPAAITWSSTGDITTTITNVEIWNCTYIGITFDSDEGAVDATLNGFSMDVSTSGTPIVAARANHSIDMTITDLELTNIAWRGILLESDHGDIDVQVTGAVVDEMDYTLFAIWAYEGSVDVSLTDAIINGVYGNEIYVYEGDLTIDFTNVEMTNIDWISLYAFAYEGAATLDLESIMIDDAGSGFYLEANQTIEVTISDLYMNDTGGDAFYVESYVGDIVLDADMVELTNIMGDGLQLSAVGGTIWVELSEVYMEVVGMGLEAICMGDIEAYASDTTMIDVASGIYLYTTTGSIIADLTNLTIMGSDDDGVYTWAPNGDITMTIDPSLITGCDDTGLHVEANGMADVMIMDSTISDCWIGALIYGDQGVTVELMNAIFDGNGEYGLRADANVGDLDLVMTGGLVNNTWMTGIYMESYDGNVSAVFDGASFAANVFSVVAMTYIEDVDMVFDACDFDGDYTASVMAEAAGDVSIVAVNNTMNGYNANADGWYYADEMEYEYDIIDPDYSTTGDYFTLTMPFEFPFAGSTYTTLYVYEDGYISLGSTASMPTDFYYWGGPPVIAPCPQGFETNIYPYYGYKVYDDRVVVQWDVYVNGESNNLRNVFEVVLYANGDIQFNYDEMESLSHSVYDYGVVMSSGYYVDLGQVLGTIDPFDNDYSSYYLTHAPMSNGFAFYAEAVGDCTAEFTGNSISNYYMGGVLLMAEEGEMWVDATGNSFSYMVGSAWIEDVPTGGILAMAWNNTIWANCQDNEFSYIVGMGAGFMSGPSAGGVDTFNIVNNTFQDVSTVSIGAATMIEDTYGDDAVVYENTKTITDNVGMDSAGIMLVTMIYIEGSVWDITLTETVANNEFTGFNKAYDFDYSYPLQIEGVTAMIGSYLMVYSDSNCTVDRTLDISENVISAMRLGSFDGMTYVYNSDGIVVMDNTVSGGGVMTLDTNVEIYNNTLEGELVDFGTGIGYDMPGEDIMGYGDTISDNGQMDITAYVNIQNNLLFSPMSGSTGIEVDADLENEYDDRNQASGSLNATINIWENTITNFDSGIDIDNDVNLYNDWGDLVATIDVLITDNWIEGAYYGIEIDQEIYCAFSSYFPAYEEEIWSSVTFETTYTITDNYVSAYYDGIYFYEWSGSWEDYVGTFANALTEGTIELIISGNEIWAGEYGIYTYTGQYSDSGSVEIVELLIEIFDNTIMGMEDYDTMGGTGIYLYDWVEAWSQNLEMDDAPLTEAVVEMLVTDNIVEGFYDGISAYVDCYSYYGLSAVDALVMIDISGNEVIASDYGILAGVDGYLYQYSYGDEASSATMFIESEITVTENVVTGMEAESLALDDEAIYVWFYTNTGVEQLASVWVTDNTITGGDIWEGTGIYIYGCENAMDVTFHVLDNTIDTIYTGIYTYYVLLDVSGNTITNVGYGMELDYSSGVVENNTVTEAYEGFYLYECVDMVFQDNVATTSLWSDSWDGADIYYCENLTFENNLIDGFSYGMYIYECEECLFTGNTITNSVWDAVEIYYSECIEFSGNTVVTSYSDGLYIYSSEDLLIEGNTISDHLYYGIYMYYSDYVIIGNNSISDVGEDGLYFYSCYDVLLYNGMFEDCGDYGIYGNSESMRWLIDGESMVRNCPVYFEGDVVVMDGGLLTLDFVSSFQVYYDYYDGIAAIVVEEGGVLDATNTAFGGWLEGLNGYSYLFDVYGELYMDNSAIYDAYQLYLGPTSTVEIHASVIQYNEMNGVFIDNASPVISGTEISYNDRAGVYISGEAADPDIKDCVIAYNERGIYAYQASLGHVVDNIFFYNDMAGIYVEQVTGAIHDNILIFNQREIFVQDSDVTIMDNQIGYSMIIEIMAEYWPLMMMDYGCCLSGSDYWYFSPEDIMSLMSNHIGVYIEDSTAVLSGNVYGMLSYAVYAVNSQIEFSDSVEMNTLVLTYFDDWYMMYNVSLPIFVFDGLFASDSMVVVNGAYIEVLDDAIFLEGCEAEISDTVMVSGDFDLYVMRGTVANVTDSEMEKVRAEGSSIGSEIMIWNTLTVYTVDQDGNPMAGIPVVIMNASEEVVDEGTSDSNGMFQATVMAAHWTSAGEDTGMNPYTVIASFEDQNASMSVTVDGPTEITMQEPEKKVWDAAPAAAMTAFAAAVVGVALISLAAAKP